MPVLVIPVALLVGLTLGALGGGGSILTVPALVYLLGQDPHAATTGSLVIVGVTALLGAVPHRRTGHVRLGQGLMFGLLGAGGALLGSVLAASVPPALLLALFSALMLVVAVVMTRGRRAAARTGGTGADGVERAVPMLALRPWRCDCRAVALLVVTATVVGVLTGFFGVGGGFAVVPALVLALRMPMPVAVGTSLVVISVNSASALAARLGQEVELDWAVIGPFTALAVVGTLVGARLTSRVSPARLSLAFTLLLVAVAVYTAARSIPALV